MPKKSPRPRLSSLLPAEPVLPSEGYRLLSRGEVVELVGVSAVTLWTLQRQNKFPRSLNLNGKTVWRSHDIERFLANLPVRRLKGDTDAPDDANV